MLIVFEVLWEEEYPHPFLQADHISKNDTTTQTCCDSCDSSDSSAISDSSDKFFFD